MCLLLLNHSCSPHAAAETRYGKELRLHLNVTFSLLGKCHLHVYLPPGADVRPDIVYLLRRGVVSAGLKRANRPASAPAADPALLQLPPCVSLFGFSFHTSSVTFPSNVAAVKRRRGLVTDRGVEVITSSYQRALPSPHNSKA